MTKPFKSSAQAGTTLFGFGFTVVNHVIKDVTGVFEALNGVGGGGVLEEGGKGLGGGDLGGSDVCYNGGLFGQDNLRVVEEIDLLGVINTT